MDPHPPLCPRNESAFFGRIGPRLVYVRLSNLPCPLTSTYYSILSPNADARSVSAQGTPSKRQETYLQDGRRADAAAIHLRRAEDGASGWFCCVIVGCVCVTVRRVYFFAVVFNPVEMCGCE